VNKGRLRIDAFTPKPEARDHLAADQPILSLKSRVPLLSPAAFGEVGAPFGRRSRR
jgi:hypothetical protein